MIRFIRNIVLFFLAIAIADSLFGIVCQYMNNHAKGGGIKTRHYVCMESDEECLVFGSSRANHHYVPHIIEDSLGLTCFNAGVDGNGIIFSYGTLRMITNRYSPQLIIYDVSGFDIFEDDNMKYLDLLKPYYYESGIDSIFWSVEPRTRLMMCSGFYRYNTTCIRVLGDYLHPMYTSPDGFVPLKKVMDYDPEFDETSEKGVDSLKIHFFKEFILLAKEKGITLVCCVSPSYLGTQSDVKYSPVKDLCEQYDVPFIYDGDDEIISINKLFFSDRTHLNANGATLYTDRLMKEILDLGLMEKRK